MLLVLAALACAPKAPPPPPPPPPLVDAGVPEAGGLYLEGFDLVWDRRPHRLRRLAVAALGTTGTHDEPLEGSLRATAQGGTWATGEKGSDTPLMTVQYARLQAPGLAFVPGRATLSLQGRAKGRDPKDVVPEATVEVTVPLPPDLGPAALAPWLTGLDVSTLPSHEDGYTPHGLSITLGEPRVEGSVVHVPVTALFEAAPVLDRAQQLKDYRSTIVVDFALVVARDAHTERVAADRTIERRVEPLASARKGAPFRAPLEVALHPGTSAAVAGLSGFTLEFEKEGPSAGRYLRALTAGLRDPRVDPAVGTWTADAELRMSNAGDLPRSIRVHGRIESTVLLLPRPVHVSRGQWRPPGGTGCASYPALAAQPCPADPGAPVELP